MDTTAGIYSLIGESRYSEAAELLEKKLEADPHNRAALSLQGFCHFHAERFDLASEAYERLVDVCPNFPHYRLQHAQSLYRAGLLEDSHEAAIRIKTDMDDEEEGSIAGPVQVADDGRAEKQKLALLRASIHFERGDLTSCQSVLSECKTEAAELTLASVAVMAREENWDGALAALVAVDQGDGVRSDISYGIAYCHYRKGCFDRAMQLVVKMIERGLKKESESLASRADPSHCQFLDEMQLIEAYNLKAAIEFDMGNAVNAAVTLAEMPERLEENVDAVTLHNEGIFGAERRNCSVVCPQAGAVSLEGECMDDSTYLRKLQYLLNNPPYPPSTFANLLILYCNHGYQDLAEDALLDNPELTDALLSQEMYDYIDGVILAETAPEEGFDKLEALLLKQSKTISNGDASAISSVTRETEKHLAVLMVLAKIRWESGDYEAAEKILRQHGETHVANKVWKLNIAHTYFVQGKYEDAARSYKAFLPESDKDLLETPAIVLANLCVSYVASDQNTRAESIVAAVQREEEAISALGDDGNRENVGIHGYLIDLVIGILYCTKGQFDFGLGRVCQRLESFDKRLNAQIWLYIKTTILSVLEKIGKHTMVTIEDRTADKIVSFLDDIELYGRNLSPMIVEDHYAYLPYDPTISSEARKIKLSLLNIFNR